MSGAASGSKRKAVGASSSRSSAGKKAKSTSSGEDASIPLGRALASTEKRTRDAAVRSLTAYLSANGAHTIEPLELGKLWKGLFYCFWMSDKPLVQQRLANDLAHLVLVHPTSTEGGGEMSQRAMAGLTFLEGFWDTLVAEWAGLDKHRIDKYYLLVRRFVAAGFRLLVEEKWQPKAVERLAGMLGKWPGGALSTNDPKVPDSLTYHLSDIYLDELEKVIETVHDEENGQEEEEEEEDLPLVPTLQLLMPFVDALATAKSKAMYDRIWSNVFEPLLDDTLRASARDDDSQYGSQDGSEQDDEQDDDDDDDDDDDEEVEAGDETTTGTEFHSFADESTLTHPIDDDESEPSLASDSDDEDEEDSENDVRYPLLLALSSVPIPTDADEDDEQLDVALVLRKAIFQALFTAASRKDATEARRRLLYQLWRDEQDRLNDS